MQILKLLENAMFSSETVTIYPLTSSVEAVPSLHGFHNTWLLSNFKMFANLVGVQWYFTMILICIFLIPNEFKHISVFLSFVFPLLQNNCLLLIFLFDFS